MKDERDLNGHSDPEEAIPIQKRRKTLKGTGELTNDKRAGCGLSHAGLIVSC
jgi:hypothetical protein